MSQNNSRSRLLVIIAVAAVAVGISVALALPMTSPAPPPQEQTKQFDCTSLSGSIKYYVVDIAGNGANETRRMAASALMDGFCNTPDLVNEISVMSFPGMGLISYGCDVAAGKIDDTSLRRSVEQYAPIYCEGAAFAILERAEYTDSAIHDFREDIASYVAAQEEESGLVGENSDGAPDPTVVTVDMEEVEASLKAITVQVENARILASDAQYFEAAKSLEAANTSLTRLASEIYS